MITFRPSAFASSIISSILVALLDLLKSFTFQETLRTALKLLPEDKTLSSIIYRCNFLPELGR